MMMRRSVIKPFRRGRMSVALVNSHDRARSLFERLLVLPAIFAPVQGDKWEGV
jgi:hypothetical protein